MRNPRKRSGRRAPSELSSAFIKGRSPRKEINASMSLTSGKRRGISFDGCGLKTSFTRTFPTRASAAVSKGELWLLADSKKVFQILSS